MRNKGRWAKKVNIVVQSLGVLTSVKGEIDSEYGHEDKHTIGHLGYLEPDVTCVGQITTVTEETDTEFGHDIKPDINNLEASTQEDSGVTGNNNVGKNETNSFSLINVIKTEPGANDGGCLCVKTETEPYYLCEGDETTLCKQENCIDDNTSCKQETCIGDEVVKKEPVFEQIDCSTSVDQYSEG